MFVIAVNTNQQSQLPVTLFPWEHVSFLYRVIQQQENQTSKDKVSYFILSKSTNKFK
jgi:hypothetical protein